MTVLHYSEADHKSIGLRSMLGIGSFLTTIVSIFTNIDPANAAILGELKISGTLDVESLGQFFDSDDSSIPIGLDPNAPDARRVPLTTFDFKDLGGVSNVDFGEFLVNEGNGIFEPVNPPPVAGGTIKDLPPFPSSNNPISDFLDLSFDANSGTELGFNIDFDLRDFTLIDYMDNGIGVVNGLGVTGVWNIKDANNNIIDTRPGQGTLSAEITYDAIPEVDNFEQYLSFLSEQGNTIEGITYSGDFTIETSQEPPEPPESVPVPEPSSIFSLVTFGLVSAGFLVGKKPQNNF